MPVENLAKRFLICYVICIIIVHIIFVLHVHRTCPDFYISMKQFFYLIKMCKIFPMDKRTT